MILSLLDTYTMLSGSTNTALINQISGFAFIILVISYIFSSIGHFTLADKKGLRYAWMAWIPIFQYYFRGKIIDDKIIIRGKAIGHASAILLGYQIVLNVLNRLYSADIVPLSTLFMISIILDVIFTIYCIFVNYRLFRLYDPEKAKLYTTLSFFSTLLQSIFYFMVRKNEPVEYFPKETPEA